MHLSVIIMNDCWEYLVEVERSLTAVEKRVGELELVPIFLVGDTDGSNVQSVLDIREGTRESSRHLCGDCVTMAFSSSSRSAREIGRVNAL